ncbi:hypothetical protein ACFLXC_06910 [Chloroflexota bacterium]
MKDSYEVVSPLGKCGTKNVKPALPVDRFEGAKIGLFWTIFTNGDVLAGMLDEELNRRFEKVEVVRLPAGKNLKWGDYPDESIEDVVKEAGIDAAIVLIGG